MTQGELVMIRFIRSASIAPGKFGDAMAFAKKVAAYLEKQTAVQMQVLVPVAGNPHRVAWSAEYPSLAAMEELNGKLMADQKYAKLLSTGKELFIAGSLNDTIWRTV
jgi:hypothetical protein